MLDVDGVDGRWRELHESPVVRELVDRCRSRVADEVWVEAGSEEHHLLPGWQQVLGRVARRRVDGPADEALRVGLDGEGGVVLVTSQSWLGESHECLTWGAEVAERVRSREGQVLALEVAALDEHGRPHELVLWESHGGEGERRERYRCWSGGDGRLELIVELYEGGHANAQRFSYASDGKLLIVEHQVLEGEHTGPDEQAWASARAAAEQPSSTTVTWDAALYSREKHLPDPSVALEGLAPPLAEAIANALDVVRDRIGTLAFLYVMVHPDSSLDRPMLLTAAAAGTRHRDRARTVTGDVSEVLHLARQGAADTATLDVFAACPPDVMRAIRAGLQALATAPDRSGYQLAEQQGARLATVLAAALNARDWPGTDDGFVAVVMTPTSAEQERVDDEPGEPGQRRFATTRAAVGDQRMDAFLTSLTAAPSTESDAEPSDAPVADRAALSDLLVSAGLQAEEAALVARDAAWGIVLERNGHGESRLGGLPVLPVDVSWPTHDGRPLTHLATIALRELPAVEGRDVLPSGGYLSFFADLAEDGGLIEPVALDEPAGEVAAVIHVADGVATHEPTPPAGHTPAKHDPPIVLRERRVQPVARLQMRSVGFGSAQRWYGIDAIGEHVLERLIDAINGTNDHQLLGNPSVVQDDPREDGEVALLHIAYDPELGFEFLDAGDLLFLGDPHDIRHSNWSRLAVHPSSC